MAEKTYLAMATTSWPRKGPGRPPFVVVKGNKYELAAKDIPKGLKDVLVEVEPDPKPEKAATSVTAKKKPAKKTTKKPASKDATVKPATVKVTPDV